MGPDGTALPGAPLKSQRPGPDNPGMGAGCRHYLVVTIEGEQRNRQAVGQEIADGFTAACAGVDEVEELLIERNRVSGPGQADLIVATRYGSAEDLVRIRGTVMRECIEKLRNEVAAFEIRELSAME
jgi:hypothetical protein